MLVSLVLAVFWAVCLACAVMHYRETQRMKKDWEPAKAEYLGHVLSNASIGEGLTEVLYSPLEYRYYRNGVAQTLIDPEDINPLIPETGVIYINPDDPSEVKPPSWRKYELLSIAAIAALVPIGLLIFGTLFVSI